MLGPANLRVILVVDDDELHRLVVRRILESDETVVLEADDGDSALRLCQESQPQAVVLDLTLPGTPGLDVCRTMKERHSGTKVLILTASDDPDLHDEGMEAGADAFLTKPFSSVSLLRVVDDLLAAHA